MTEDVIILMGINGGQGSGELSAFNLVIRVPSANRVPLSRVDWGTPLVAQWQRLQAPNAGGLGLIPGQGTRSHMPQLTPSTAKYMYKFFFKSRPEEKKKE